MARTLGIDPGIILAESNPRMNAARLAAAHVYKRADAEQEREQKSRSTT